MPEFRVETPQRCYPAIVQRGIVARTADYLPPKSGKIFVVSTEDVWRHQGAALAKPLADSNYDRLFLPCGEDRMRLAPLKRLDEQMLALGADRTSMVIAYGGGIVNDMAGFL